MKLEAFLRIQTVGDITKSIFTWEEKREISQKKKEEKRKKRQEEKTTKKKIDFKMDTMEFNEDKIPSKNELARVESPFNFGTESVNISIRKLSNRSPIRAHNRSPIRVQNASPELKKLE